MRRRFPAGLWLAAAWALLAGAWPAGAAWCIARNGAPEKALQTALDYACSPAGGADCAPIQASGLCYLPNTVAAHSSYAFNYIFQRAHAAPGACDFAGTATITLTDPSYGSCTYPASPSIKSARFRYRDDYVAVTRRGDYPHPITIYTSQHASRFVLLSPHPFAKKKKKKKKIPSISSFPSPLISRLWVDPATVLLGGAEDGSDEAREDGGEARRVEPAGIAARRHGSPSVAREVASAEDDRPCETPGSGGPEARWPGSHPAEEMVAAADARHAGCDEEVLEAALHFLVLRLAAMVTRKDSSGGRVVL